MYALKLASLKKSYGRRTIFSGLEGDYSVEVLGLAGPNGAGKTTLLNIMAGLSRPTGGSVTWRFGDDALVDGEFRRRMSFCGPGIDLYPDLSCADNVAFIAKLRGVAMPDFAALFAGSGLPDVAAQPYGSLSSGQKQRVRLISSTFFSPDLLFLDEPGSNLDRQGADVVREMIASRRGHGRMTVLASNDAEELALCDATIRLGPL